MLVSSLHCLFPPALFRYVSCAARGVPPEPAELRPRRASPVRRRINHKISALVMAAPITYLKGFGCTHYSVSVLLFTKIEIYRAHACLSYLSHTSFDARHSLTNYRLSRDAPVLRHKRQELLTAYETCLDNAHVLHHLVRGN